MTTADWALTISLGSAMVSLAGFVWNVWSKFIYPKPKIRVSLQRIRVFQGKPTSLRALSLTAVNMGPAPVQLQLAVGDGGRRWWKRKPKSYGVLNPLQDWPHKQNHTDGPFSGGLPKKLEVGDSFTIYLTLQLDDLLNGKLDRIGFVDTFGRRHWCTTDEVVTVRKKSLAEAPAGVEEKPAKPEMLGSPE